MPSAPLSTWESIVCPKPQPESEFKPTQDRPLEAPPPRRRLSFPSPSHQLISPLNEDREPFKAMASLLLSLTSLTAVLGAGNR